MIAEALVNPPPFSFCFPFPLSTFPLVFDFAGLLAEGAVNVGFEGLGFDFDFVTLEEEEAEVDEVVGG